MRAVLALVASAALASCISNSLNEVLSGTWTGADNRADGTVYTSTVTLTQTGSNVTGTVVAKSGANVVYSASISGTYSAPTFTFAIQATAGNVTGSPTCAFTLNGTATFSNSGNGPSGPTHTLSGLYGGSAPGCATATVNDTFVWALQ